MEWSGAAMSLRAELVRLGLRWFVKRKIGPATTLEALRRQDAFLERLVPPSPKGTQATHVDLDGVKAVAVVTPASLGGRLVLYLHGGGHVSGSPALYGDFTWRIAAASSALNLRYNSLPHVPRIGLRHRPTSPKAKSWKNEASFLELPCCFNPKSFRNAAAILRQS